MEDENEDDGETPPLDDDNDDELKAGLSLVDECVVEPLEDDTVDDEDAVDDDDVDVDTDDE